MTTLDAIKLARQNKISPAGSIFLILIMEHGPVRPSKLAELAGCSTAHVTGVVDRLIKDGWAERREAGNVDRRTKPIFATDKAFELFNTALETAEA